MNHSVISSIYARILRPNTGPITDALLLSLATEHTGQEERLGIEIDPRVFAFVSSNDESTIDALRSIGGPVHVADPTWRFQAVLSVLWPKGRKIRSMGLESYNPFSTIPETDWRILRGVLQPDKPEVNLSDSDWRKKVEDALSNKGEVVLYADRNDSRKLKTAIGTLSTTPLNIDFMRLYPRVSGAVKTHFGMKVTLQLPEALS